MPRRIGILTWHRLINPGAVLQAYSQARAFQKHFPEAVVRVVDVEFRKHTRVRYRRMLSEAIRLQTLTFREFRSYQRAVERHTPLGEPSMSADGYQDVVDALKNRYDVLVVGSDELWMTIGARSPAPFPNVFWLSPDLPGKKIAFAVSANTCTLEDIDPEDRRTACSLLAAFDFIGVRDDHTGSLVRALQGGGPEVVKVPDPTFTYESPDGQIAERVKRKLVRAGVKLGAPVLGIYGYFSPGSQRILSDLALHYRAKGWQIVSLMYEHDFVDLDLRGVLNPFEWAQAFRHCDACVTNTFHGTLFSMMQGTPFVSMEEGEYSLEHVGKIRDVLSEMNLMHHYCHLSDLRSHEDLVAKVESVRVGFDEAAVADEVGRMRAKYLDRLRAMASIL